MPTYDYVCLECKIEFEVFHPMSQEPGAKCPKCKKHTIERRIGTGGGVIFKGSGFHCNDYPRDDSYPIITTEGNEKKYHKFD